MPKEVWGTTAVLDHMRERPFVAEALLFDRIVVPVPVPEELDRWETSGRNPSLQRHLVDILGCDGGPDDLAVQIPWTKEHRVRYEALRNAAGLGGTGAILRSLASDVEFDQTIIAAAREQGATDPYFLTRLVLSDDANHDRDREYLSRLPGVWVEAVPAYSSFAAAAAELPIDVVLADQVRGNEQLVAIFGWEFFVPEDSGKSDLQLLQETADLARRPDFREARADFQEWRRAMVKDGVESETMLADMELRLARYNDAIRSGVRKTRTLNAFTLMGIAASIAGFFAFPPAGLAGAFIALGSFTADKVLKTEPPSQNDKVAAIVYDARKHFGWHATS